MKSSLKEQGFLTIKELRALPQYPSDHAFQQGPVAVIECAQEIPCNPCEAACKFGAIRVGTPITEIPKFYADLCTGCSLCVAKCPGLAIFVVDKTYSAKMATVAFPHEYLPLPKQGNMVDAVNREGVVVCQAQVIRVVSPQSFDRTPVVTVAVPKELADEVRGMRQLTEVSSHD